VLPALTARGRAIEVKDVRHGSSSSASTPLSR